jgi:hypothetical protein
MEYPNHWKEGKIVLAFQFVRPSNSSSKIKGRDKKKKTNFCCFYSGRIFIYFEIYRGMD